MIMSKSFKSVFESFKTFVSHWFWILGSVRQQVRHLESRHYRLLCVVD